VTAFFISFEVKCLRGKKVGRLLFIDWITFIKWLLGELIVLDLNTSKKYSTNEFDLSMSDMAYYWVLLLVGFVLYVIIYFSLHVRKNLLLIVIKLY
jgi:hypothetical protein